MTEKEKYPENENLVETAVRDIAHEFNVIVDSVNEGDSKFVHDRYFRFAFAKPSRMAELLTLFSRHNPSLKAFLDTIDLASLRGASENHSNDKHAGSADLVFEANLKNGGVTGLYVGIIAEHKSDEDDLVMNQISEYYHHLFLERKKDVPVVAFIVYNGEKGWDPLADVHFAEYPEFYHDIGYPFKAIYLDVGHGINDVELKGLSPITLVALTAMKYIWDMEKFSVSFREAAMHLLKMQNTEEGRDFIKQSLSYFFWKWPYKSEVIKMDRPEIIANKGYETFGEHFFNAGEAKGVSNAISVFEELGVSPEKIAEAKARLSALSKK
ncbi:Rpn family recombination-promoting nuclease/putative transposase [Fibrobacter sp. UBA3629]|jgi:hypothetical protein|uniref:Rpn family recombination-promoting nuclease/putative transposase n=1 Tax=Fibrobacter sp. UBA3629 TaxID=1946530 RepID=UPI0025C533AF|nr:Rpn family recombination-promoting nuclease/putative transposase [Fibrobacter sp. UBA3629]